MYSRPCYPPSHLCWGALDLVNVERERESNLVGPVLGTPRDLGLVLAWRREDKGGQLPNHR